MSWNCASDWGHRPLSRGARRKTTTYETAWRAWRDLEHDLQEAITQYAKNEGLDRNDIEQAVRNA